MSGLFSAPKIQAPTPISAPPTPVGDTAEAERTRKAQDEARAKQKTSRGRASTILTGNQGVQGQGASTASRTLLGA